MRLSKETRWDEKELYSGLIPLHIVHRATQEGFFGLEMIEELGRHGYKLSPGTLYPLLHSLEQKGLLRSHQHLEAGRIRRIYKSTARGRKALADVKQKVSKLFGILFDGELHKTRKKAIRS